MTGSLKAELSGRPPTPTSFRMLLPPGWRGFGVDEGAEQTMAGLLRARFQQAARPELEAAVRANVARYFRSLRSSGATGIYLPVDAGEEAPVGMSIVASRFTAPDGSTVAASATSRSRGTAGTIDLGPHILHRWTEAQDAPESAEGVAGRSIHYLIEAPNSDRRRAMMLATGLLHVVGEEESEGVALMEALSDGIVGTFRWT